MCVRVICISPFLCKLYIFSRVPSLEGVYNKVKQQNAVVFSAWWLFVSFYTTYELIKQSLCVSQHIQNTQGGRGTIDTHTHIHSGIINNVLLEVFSLALTLKYTDSRQCKKSVLWAHVHVHKYRHTQRHSHLGTVKSLPRDNVCQGMIGLHIITGSTRTHTHSLSLSLSRSRTVALSARSGLNERQQ